MPATANATYDLALAVRSVGAHLNRDALASLREIGGEEARTSAAIAEAEVTKLVLNLDDGPENHSRRTQFLKRMVGFAHEYRLDIALAYYPPYHSKYNPIERCWGILELHWNGALLDSVEAVLGYAGTMTWRGNHPEVVLIEEAYSKEVKLSQKEMKALESEVVRLPTLEKWFVSIPGRSGIARQN